MYFGLWNSLEIFQSIMNSILQELLHKEVLAKYINNFVILAKTRKIEERTIYFLKMVEKYNFCFKKSKYNFDIK